MSESPATKAQSLYQKREKIYTKIISGKFQNYRMLSGALIYGAFFIMPWISFGDRPAVYFDLQARQFHILAMNFWPQDFMFLAWFLIIAAFSLFLFTTVAGRLWCGFACPQTMWTLFFMTIEQWIEGKPHTRRHLDAEPMSLRKFSLKFAKHAIWLAIALGTGITFVSYFYPIRELLTDAFHWQMPMVAVFWVGIFTYLTYIDAAWLREQVCIYMCPYARFQSVMYDRNTLLVAYNEKIGEPRASMKRQAPDSGHCIDCEQCVQVCPTGIDIRHGSQIACINCALCVDACKDVMESVGRPADLITFTTLEQQEGHPLKLVRPKTIAYTLVLAIMCSLLAYNLWTRTSVEASILRDRDHIYRVINADTTANDYLLKIANKSQETQHYRLQVQGNDFTMENLPPLSLEKAELREVLITLTTHRQMTGSQPVKIDIVSADDGKVLDTLETRFVFAPPH